MKKHHYLAVAVLAYLFFVIAGTPASTVLTLLDDKFPDLKTQGVSGSVWNGAAKQITFQSKYIIEQVNWSFCGWCLLTGEASFNVDAQYRQRPAHAQLGIGISGKMIARRLQTELDAKFIAELANIPFGELEGILAINLDILSWRQGEVPRAEGMLNWHNAAITVAETVNLGEVLIELSDSNDNPLTAAISNSSGQLNVNGDAHITDEANYELELKLAPSKKSSKNLRNSLSMIAKKQSDGSFLVINKGHLNQLGIM